MECSSMKIHEITESKKQLDEILPALAIGGAGAALTASELYQMKQAYDRGEMSAADIAKQVGTDIAATVAGLGAIKLANKSWKYGKKMFKSKKEAELSK